MKSFRKYILVFLLAGAALSIYFFAHLAAFPGKIDTPSFQPDKDNVIWTFQQGIVYRHKGTPPLLEVSGSHYEMGLQYGVLLRPEIISALSDYKNILQLSADNMKLPPPMLTAALKWQAKRMAKRLPERFREEIRGVSDGSGVPESAILAVSLLYDVLMTNGCTGVLMRTEQGAVIHGHNQEPYGFGYGGLLGKHTVVVRYKSEGYHQITHIDVPLFMGVETGYNDQGLTYTQETYSIRETNPEGFPIVYAARIALETSATLEEVHQVLGGFSIASPGGMLWSDRTEQRGMRLEVLPSQQVMQKFEHGILWDFNNIVDPELARQQHPRTNLAGFNRDRERVAAAFPGKPAYTVADAVQFLRSHHTPEGKDYSWLGSHSAIANAWGQQMVIFDPEGDGFYMALGESFAALRTVFHFQNDFSKSPERFMDAKAIDPIIEKAARISTGMLNAAERLNAYLELAKAYPAEANVHALVAHESFAQERWDLFTIHAEKAFALAPDVPEFRLYAGLAAHHAGNWQQAIEYLEDTGSAYPLSTASVTGATEHNPDLSPEQEIYRLTALASAWKNKDMQRSKRYETERQDLLERYDAVSYFKTDILPKFEKLEGK